VPRRGERIAEPPAGVTSDTSPQQTRADHAVRRLRRRGC
jgi:hypothetical protein